MNPRLNPDPKSGIRQILEEKFRILISLPAAERESALAWMLEEDAKADRDVVDLMRSAFGADVVDGVEQIKLMLPDFGKAQEQFLRGLLDGSLSFADFDQWWMRNMEGVSDEKPN